MAAEYTPQLAAKKSVEFWATEDDNWRIGEWPDLSDRFLITPGDLEHWYNTLAAQGRAWEALRYLYDIHPTLLKDSTDAVNQGTKTLDEIAGILSLKKSVISNEIDALVEFWKKRKTAEQLNNRIEQKAQKEKTKADPYLGSNLKPAAVTELLQEYKLNNIASEELRIYIAGRIIDLQKFLTAASTRTVARNTIRLEITAWEQETHLDYLAARKIKIQENDPDDGRKKTEREIHKEITELQADITRADTHLAKLHKNISEAMKQIGADEMTEFQATRTLTSAFSEIIDRVKDYYSDPENILMDGVFTPKEIIWQMTATEFRDPQYRPDFVATINEAMKPHNLFNPDFKSKGVGREAARLLQKIVKSYGEEALAAIPTEEDDNATPPNSIPAALTTDEPGNVKPTPPPQGHRGSTKKEEVFLA
jgi:hypothetical protein